MRRVLAAVCALAAASFVCGCATISPHLSELSGKAAADNASVAQSQGAEKTKDARGRYDAFLAANSLKKPLSFYQERLKEQLNGLTSGNKEVFDEDAAWAFPCVFDERVRAVAAAHVGLARLSLAENDAKGALAHASAAVDGILDNMISPVGYSPLLEEAYGIQELAYGTVGAAGDKLLARANGDLIRDYDKSAQAETDRGLKARADLLCRRQMSALDDIVDDVNVHRDVVAQQKFNAAGNAVIGGLNQVNKIVQARAGGTSSYAGPTGGGAQMQPWLEGAKTLSAAIAASNAQTAAPMGGLAFSQGALVLDKNAKSLDIIKAFAASAAAMSGDASLKQTAQAVMNATDAVAKGRQGADGPKPETLAALGQSLNALQGHLTAPSANAR